MEVGNYEEDVDMKFSWQSQKSLNVMRRKRFKMVRLVIKKRRRMSWIRRIEEYEI